MSLEQVRQILGAEEFPGLRSLDPETAGGFFLSASGESVLTVLFDRQKNTLRYIEISSDFRYVLSMRESAARIAYTNWESELSFEDWAVRTLRLEASKDEVFHALGLLDQENFAEVDTIYVEYRPRDTHYAEEHWSRNSSGTSLLCFQEASQGNKRMRIGFLEGTIESISLTTER